MYTCTYMYIHACTLSQLDDKNYLHMHASAKDDPP